MGETALHKGFDFAHAVRQALKPIARQMLGREGFARLAAGLIMRSIRNFDGRPATADMARPALLALQPDRFRGDLDALHQDGHFRVLRMSFTWQMRLLMLFYRGEFEPDAMFQPNDNVVVLRKQNALRRALRPLIRTLYKRLNIVATIGAGVHYWRDLDWGVVSTALGYPYVVLHRENLVASKITHEALMTRYKRWGTFQGSLIIVHNEVSRATLTAAGFASPDRVMVLGAVRMDGLVAAIAAQTATKARLKHRPQVLFFSFTEGAGLALFSENVGGGVLHNWSPDGVQGWVKLFDSTHATIVRLAHEMKDVDFVVKLKWDGNTRERLNRALEKAGLTTEPLDNLSITADGDVHQLILNSDVVVGFGSTALLEAAAAQKPVVVPIMHEAALSKNASRVPFGSELALFDVARSEEELARMVRARLADGHVPDAVQKLRNQAFEKYVSTMTGGAAQRYVEALQAVTGDMNGEPRRLGTYGS